MSDTAKAGGGLGKKLVFSAITTVALLGVLELGVRLSGETSKPGYRLKQGLAWGMQANFNGKLRSKEVGEFQVTTNELGLRTPYSPKPAEGEQKTIVMLGDSIIFGWGCGADCQTSRWMEEHLASLKGPGTWRVVNAGQPGYSSFQSYVLLREFGVDYAPDVVVLEIAGHNFRDAQASDLEALSASTQGASAVLEKLHLYRLLRKAFDSDPVASLDPQATPVGAAIQSEHTSDPEADSDAPTTRVPVEDFEAILADLGDLGRKHGFTVVVNQPGFMEFMSGPYQKALGDAQERGDIIWTNCGEHIRAAGLVNQTFWIDDGHHWNPRGAQTAGKIMAECLDSVGALD